MPPSRRGARARTRTLMLETAIAADAGGRHAVGERRRRSGRGVARHRLSLFSEPGGAGAGGGRRGARPDPDLALGRPPMPEARVADLLGYVDAAHRRVRGDVQGGAASCRSTSGRGARPARWATSRRSRAAIASTCCRTAIAPLRDTLPPAAVRAPRPGAVAGLRRRGADRAQGHLGPRIRRDPQRRALGRRGRWSGRPSPRRPRRKPAESRRHAANSQKC